MAVRLGAGGHTRPLLVPLVKYVANMHGDESVGRELLLALLELLATRYGREERITRLLNTTEIHILPSMNPVCVNNRIRDTTSTQDGFERVTRHNHNGVDLNRGFPGPAGLNLTREELRQDRQPEVAAVIDWVLDKAAQTHVDVKGNHLLFIGLQRKRLLNKKYLWFLGSESTV